jgi:hypothetical protein
MSDYYGSRKALFVITRHVFSYREEKQCQTCVNKPCLWKSIFSKLDFATHLHSTLIMCDRDEFSSQLTLSQSLNDVLVRLSVRMTLRTCTLAEG